MLRNSFLPPYYDGLSSKSCGEIIFQSETSFTIVCKFCSIKIFEFNEFVEHFRNTHWAEVNLADTILKQLDVKNLELQVEEDNGNEYIKTEEQVVCEESIFTDDDEWTPEKQNHHNENDSSDMETISIMKKKVNKKKQTYKCSFCNHTFTNKSPYETHLQKHKSNEFKCDKCSKTFSKKSQLTVHLITHNGYSCKFCPKIFKTYDSLRYHKETHIQTKNYVCDFEKCGKAFANKRRLNAHKRLHYCEPYICEVCGCRQRHKTALADHMRKHTGERPYACNLCDRRFTTNSLMNEHKACHETERRHVCDVCGKSFNRQKALYHHKPLHLGIKKFVCKMCGAAYAQAAGLSAHMRRHKGDKIIATAETNSTNDLFNVFISPKINL